jgi:hypothetical protein
MVIKLSALECAECFLRIEIKPSILHITTHLFSHEQGTMHDAVVPSAVHFCSGTLRTSVLLFIRAIKFVRRGFFFNSGDRFLYICKSL